MKVSESVQIDSNQSKELENDFESMFRGVEGRFEAKALPERFFAQTGMESKKDLFERIIIIYGIKMIMH